MTKVALLDIQTEADYDKAVEYMHQLLDFVGDDVLHPLFGILDFVSDMVIKYDDKHYRLPRSQPLEVLRFLMSQYSLNETDLMPELGEISVVNAILCGNQQMTKDQIEAVSKRFYVSAAAFT